MKSLRSWFLGLSLITPLLAGCGSAPDVDAHRNAVGQFGTLRFEIDADKPLSQGSNDLRISIHDATADEPFTGAAVDLSAIMPAMAHDAPNAATDEVGDGTYLARDVSLSMPGRWEIHVQASRSDATDEVRFVYDIP
ncbi:MAG TPA: FixH family protein [Polyangium sp.]|nr:FixH family protein [Polyangium sp.]